jgi:hypothetical protein
MAFDFGALRSGPNDGQDHNGTQLGVRTVDSKFDRGWWFYAKICQTSGRGPSVGEAVRGGNCDMLAMGLREDVAIGA